MSTDVLDIASLIFALWLSGIYYEACGYDIPKLKNYYV